MSWWGAFLFTRDESTIIISSLTGLGLGIIITLMVKLKMNPDFYQLSVPVLIMVYFFYNILLYGMFMGVPFFHLFLGVIAGYYWANYIIIHDIRDHKREILRISVFCTAFMTLICFSSAKIALANESTASEFEHMFRLPFELTRPLLITSLAAGGLILIVIQYLLVKYTMQWTLRKRM